MDKYEKAQARFSKASEATKDAQAALDKAEREFNDAMAALETLEGQPWPSFKEMRGILRYPHSRERGT